MLNCQWLILLLLCSGTTLYSAPKLVLDKKVIDFKSFPANKEQKHQLIISNSGSSVLKIKAVRTTCSCSKITVKTKSIAPGSKTLLTVVLAPNSLNSAFSKSIFIESNDSSQRFYKVELKGAAIPLYSIKPQNSFYLSNITRQKGFSKTFKVKFSAPIDKIKLGKPKITGLKLKLTSSRNKKTNTLTITAASPEKLSSGQFNSTVAIPVVTPKKWPPIKLTITGRVND